MTFHIVIIRDFSGSNTNLILNPTFTYNDSCWKMKGSKFITHECCSWLLQLEYIARTATHRSRLLLSFSLSTQEDLWTCACCEALDLWQQMWHKFFLLVLNTDRSGGSSPAAHTHWEHLHKPTWTRSDFQHRLPAFLGSALQEHNMTAWHSEHAWVHSE